MEDDIAEVAAIEFEKVDDPQLLRQFDAKPWNKDCASAGVNLRIAAVMVSKTKPELIQVVRELEEEDLFELLECLYDQKNRFVAFSELLGAAASRLIICCSVVAIEMEAPSEIGFGPMERVAI